MVNITCRAYGENSPEAEKHKVPEALWRQIAADEKLAAAIAKTANWLAVRNKGACTQVDDLISDLRFATALALRKFKLDHSVPENVPLAFEADKEWTRYAQSTLVNARNDLGNRLGAEKALRAKHVSRDASPERAGDSDDAWREGLDAAESARRSDDALRRRLDAAAVAYALSRVSPASRRLYEEAFVRHATQRRLAGERGMALSSFQAGPWKTMIDEFRRALAE